MWVSIGRGRARVYRFLPNVMRTGSEHLQHALEADSTGQVRVCVHVPILTKADLSCK